MKELSDEQIEKILDLLKKGVSFPEDYGQNLIKYLQRTKNSLFTRSPKLYFRVFEEELN
jgi:predicted outer membrane protein